MKRLLSVFLALVLCMSAVVLTATAEEPKHIIVTYDTLGVTPPALAEIQDKVNERTIPEIGVEVEFKPVSAYDAFSLFPTWLATGERIDLMMPLLQDVRSYVDQGLIDPLDKLIDENAPYIKQMIEEGFPITSCNVVDGQTYAVLAIPNMFGSNGAFIARKKFVDEVGYQYDPDKIYTYDDLTELFAKIKEAHPEMYPCGVVTTGITSTQYAYAAMAPFDSINGAQYYTGVLNGADGTTVVDLFETEEYKSYLDHLRAWNLAGYIHPDASTTDSTNVALRDAGVSAGFFMVGAPIQVSEDDYAFNLSPKFVTSSGMGGWVVPITAKEPEAAIRFMDLVWKDEALMNLIQWGVEGEHYVVKDAGIGLVGFPEGVDATTSTYYNTLGLWGDARKIYTWVANNNQAANDAYTEEAMKIQTLGKGISYSAANVMNEFAAVSAVVAQYIPALESGSVDLDVYYPEFISALKAAGLDTIIADKQAQFDAQYGK